MNGGGILPRHFCQALGRTACGGCQQTPQLHLPQKGQNAVQNRCLTGAGTAGDEQQAGGSRLPDSLLLLGRIFNAAFLCHVPDHSVQIPGCREAVACEMLQALGAVGFRLMKLGQVDHRNACQRFPHQPVCLQQPLDSLPNHIPIHAQKLSRGRNQLVLRQEAVACGQIVIQFKKDTSFHTPGIVTRHTQFNGEAVHRAEGGFQPLIHQKVRIVIQQLNGAVAVEFVGTNRQLCRQLMHREEFHQLAHAHLELEFLADGSGLFPGNAGHLCQPFRLPFHDQQSLGAEMLHDSCRHPGADALDDTAG